MKTTDRFSLATKITMQILEPYRGKIDDFAKVRFDIKGVVADMLEQNIPIKRIQKFARNMVPRPNIYQNKFRRIEQLLYFREWAISLAMKYSNPVYTRLMIKTWNELYDLGVIVTDVGVETKENQFLLKMERILGMAEKAEKMVQEQTIKQASPPPELL